ncbi:MAG: DUF1844 domain-containing protein [Thermoanaerobaculia bacterium]
MSEKSIKVVDKRIFTPEGDLRDEYRFLEEEGRSTPDEAQAPAAPEPQPPPAPSPAAPAKEPLVAAGAPRPLTPPPPGYPAAQGGSAGFFDLLGMLAEPASMYLGDAPFPGGQVGTDLDMARLHIDLLGILQQKTHGSLDAQEASVLDDLLYRLRLRYVQKRGL